MAGVIIKVPVPELRSAMNKYENAKADLSTAMSQLSSLVGSLKSVWDSPAGSKFVNQYNSMHGNLKTSEARMQDAIDELNEAAKSYQDAETTSDSAVSPLELGDPFNG